MATIITREVGATAKGSPLTNAEVDQNFINLNEALATVAFTAGTMDGVAIGQTTAAAGKFTELVVTGNTTLGDAYGDTITVNGKLKLQSTDYDFVIQRAAYANFAMLSFNTASPGSSWGIGVRANTVSTEDSFSIYSSTLGANAVSILNNGNMTVAGSGTFVGGLTIGSPLLISGAANGAIEARILNSASDTNANARLLIGNPGLTEYGTVSYHSAGFTSSGLRIASSLGLLARAGLAGGVVIGTEPATSITFGTNNTARMTLSGTGVLAINSALAADVGAGAATIKLFGNQNTERFEITSGQAFIRLMSPNSVDVAAPAAMTDGILLGGLQFGGYTGSQWSRAGMLAGYGVGTWSPSSVPMLLAFEMAAPGSTAMTRQGTISHLGMSIGPSLPNGRLDVQMGNSDGIVMYQSADNTQHIQSYLEGHWSDRGSYGLPSNTLRLQFDGGNLQLGVGNALYVQYDGKISIGNITPQAIFHVKTGADRSISFADQVSVTGASVLAATNEGYTVNTPLEIRASGTTLPMGNLALSAGNLVFGNRTATDGQIQLWNGDQAGGYAIGIEGNTQFFRSAVQYRWYIGSFANGGTAGTYMTLTSTALTVAGQILGATTGYNPATTSWSSNAALKATGNYGGGISLVDNGTAGFTMWTQNSGSEFYLGYGLTSTAAAAKLTLTSAGHLTVNGSMQSNDATTNTRIVASGGYGYIGNTTNHPVILQVNNAQQALFLTTNVQFEKHINASNAQEFAMRIDATPSAVAANWYRVATMDATNQPIEVDLVIKETGQHVNTVIRVFKGTGNYTCEAFTGGRYVYANSIKRVRVINLGVNQGVHIDVQFGDPNTSAHVILANTRATARGMVTLVAFTDQGSAAAGHVYETWGYQRTYGTSDTGQNILMKDNGSIFTRAGGEIGIYRTSDLAGVFTMSGDSGVGNLQVSGGGSPYMTFSANSVERMRIDPSSVRVARTTHMTSGGDFQVGGGIGIIAPNASSSSYLRVVDSDWYNSTWRGLHIVQHGPSEGGNIAYLPVAAASLTEIQFVNSSGLAINTNSGNPIYFGIGTVEKLRISSAGVSIGGAMSGAEASVLEVINNTTAPRISVSSTATATNSGFQFLSSATWKGGLYRNGSNDSIGIFTTGDGTNPALRVDSTGDIVVKKSMSVRHIDGKVFNDITSNSSALYLNYSTPHPVWFGQGAQRNLASNGDVSARDVFAFRTATTGYLYMGSDTTKYLGFDSANYQLVGAQLFINGYKAASEDSASGTAWKATRQAAIGGTTSNWNTHFGETPAHMRTWTETSSGTGTGGPTGGTWWFIENMRHSNSDNLWGRQNAWGWEDNALRFLSRNIQGGGFGAWVEFIHTDNAANLLAGKTINGNFGVSNGSMIKIADSNHGMIKTAEIDGPTFRGYAGFRWATGVDGATERMRLTDGNQLSLPNYASSLLIGSTAPTYTLRDGHDRGLLYLSGGYPNITLHSNSTTNVNHGASIQFVSTASGGHCFVIGHSGDGQNFDIGQYLNTSSGSNYNPHNGISSYGGGYTRIRIKANGYIGLGGPFGSGYTDPEYPLDIRGNTKVTGTFTSTGSVSCNSLNVNGGFTVTNMGQVTSSNNAGFNGLTIGVSTSAPYGNETGVDRGIGFRAVSAIDYGITTIMEAYGPSYSKLCINWHTGIRIGAYPDYGGIRMYTGTTTGTQGTEIFSVGKGDGNVRVVNDLYIGDNMDTSRLRIGTNGAYLCRYPPDGSINLRTGQGALYFNSEAYANDGGAYPAAFVFNSWRSGAGDGTGTRFLNKNANHSYGVVAEFRTEGAGSDRPSILFSSAHAYNAADSNRSITWSVGFASGTDNGFRISQNHGYMSGEGWGYEVLRIDALTRNTHVFYPFSTYGGTAWFQGKTSESSYATITPGAGHLDRYSYLTFKSTFATAGYGGGDTQPRDVAQLQGAIPYGAWSNMTLTCYVNTGTDNPTWSQCWLALGNRYFRVSMLAGSGNRLVYADQDGTLTNSSSDGTLKRNIVTITDGLEKIMQMNPIRFDWKQPAIHGEGREIGFIAQEVLPIWPEVIGQNYDGTYSLDYQKLTAGLVAAVKDQQAIIEQQQSMLEALLARVTALENK